MQYVGRLVSSVYNTITPSINPSTLNGAIDVIVVEREVETDVPVTLDDGTQSTVRKRTTELSGSPFHVRFGKMSVLRPGERKVTLHLNGSSEPLPFAMKVGENGEAFFIMEIDEDAEDVPEDLVTSPIVSATGDAAAEPSAEVTAEPEPLDLGESAHPTRAPTEVSDGTNEAEEGDEAYPAPFGAAEQPVGAAPPVAAEDVEAPAADELLHAVGRRRDLLSVLDIEGYKVTKDRQAEAISEGNRFALEVPLSRHQGGLGSVGLNMRLDRPHSLWKRRLMTRLAQSQASDEKGEERDGDSQPAPGTSSAMQRRKSLGRRASDTSLQTVDPQEASSEANAEAWRPHVPVSLSDSALVYRGLRYAYDAPTSNAQLVTNEEPPEDPDEELDETGAKASTSETDMAGRLACSGDDPYLFQLEKDSSPLYAFELSLCATEQFDTSDPVQSAFLFNDGRVSFQRFLEDDSIIQDSRLCMRHQDTYYTWANASEMLATLAYYRRTLHAERSHNASQSSASRDTRSIWRRWWSGSGGQDQPKESKEKPAGSGTKDGAERKQSTGSDGEAAARPPPASPKQRANTDLPPRSPRTAPVPGTSGAEAPAKPTVLEPVPLERLAGRAEPAQPAGDAGKAGKAGDAGKQGEAGKPAGDATAESGPSDTTAKEPAADAGQRPAPTEPAPAEPVPAEAAGKGEAAAEGATKPGSASTRSGATRTVPRKTYAKSLRLTSDQLKQLNLRKGANQITFSVTSSYSGVATCTARIFLWESTHQVVVSDIDGTITKSDALGHVFTLMGRDWTHLGVAKLYHDIAKNGYRIMYLTSRAIGQAEITREYLKNIDQNGFRLPDGPVIMSPDRLIASLHREVILRKPEVFKMACLRDIARLFGAEMRHPAPGTENPEESHDQMHGNVPFYAGFGNRITDALSYRSVNIPSSRIFTIDSNGEVKMELLELAGYKSSYPNMTDLVDQMFPPVSHQPRDAKSAAYTDFNFWREELPPVELPPDDDLVSSAPSSPATRASRGPTSPRLDSAASPGSPSGGASGYASDVSLSQEAPPRQSRFSRFGLGSLGLGRRRERTPQAEQPAQGGDSLVELEPSTMALPDSVLDPMGLPNVSQLSLGSSPVSSSDPTLVDDTSSSSEEEQEGEDDGRLSPAARRRRHRRRQERESTAAEPSTPPAYEAVAAPGQARDGAQFSTSGTSSPEDEDPLLAAGDIQFEWRG